MKYQILELGDICEFVYGESLIESKREAGQVPVYGSNGIVGWHDQAITKAATIIIGRKGSIGKINFSTVPCYPIDTTYYIDTTKISCDLYWLYYNLLALDLTNLNKSAAVPGLNRNDAYEKKIILPPLAEQKRIAAIAQKADRLRRTRRYALQVSDTFLQSVFLEMFGDPLINPNGWNLTELNDACVKITDGTHHMPETVDNGIPILRVLNIKNGYIDIYELKFILEQDYQTIIKRSPLGFGDVLLTCLGTVGNTAIFNFKSKFTLVRNIALIKPDYQKIAPEFLLYTLRTDYLQSQIRARTRQSSQGALYINEIQQLKIVLPPLPLQEKFAQIVQKFERFRTQQREAERQAEHLFQTILHRAFRGELFSQDFNNDRASDLLEQIDAEQTKPAAETLTANQPLGKTSDYPVTKAQQQDILPIQLTLPGLE